MAQWSASGRWHFFFFNQEKWKHKEWNKCWKLSFTGTIKTMQAVCSHNTCLLIKTCRGKNSNFWCHSQNVRTVLIKLVLYGDEKHVLPVPCNKTLSQTWQLSKLPKTSLFCLISLEHMEKQLLCLRQEGISIQTKSDCVDSLFNTENKNIHWKILFQKILFHMYFFFNPFTHLFYLHCEYFNYMCGVLSLSKYYFTCYIILLKDTL